MSRRLKAVNTRGTLRQRTFLGASVDSVHRSVLRTGIWAPPFVQRRVIYCNHTADPSAFDETSAATVTRSCQDDEGDDVWRSIGDATGACVGATRNVLGPGDRTSTRKVERATRRVRPYPAKGRAGPGVPRARPNGEGAPEARSEYATTNTRHYRNVSGGSS